MSHPVDGTLSFRPKPLVGALHAGVTLMLSFSVNGALLNIDGGLSCASHACGTMMLREAVNKTLHQGKFFLSKTFKAVLPLESHLPMNRADTLSKSTLSCAEGAGTGLMQDQAVRSTFS